MNWFEMMNVDLPNLTSIKYEVGFFTNVHVATLKSSSNFWILIVFRYSKSTKWLSWRLIYRHTRLFYWEYFAWNAFSVDINTKIVSHIPKIYHLDFIQSINSTIESVFCPIILVMMLNILFLISLDSLKLNQLKSVMIVLDQWKHSKSMDWIDWKRSKSETIHLLRKRIVMEMMHRNHFTYWIVNRWNPFKLVNIVSVILEENLNWRIYHNYNPFKSGRLEMTHTISVIVHLWFEVLNWYWCSD